MIKLFEEYNQYYTSITENEFYAMGYEPRIFNDGEINYIHDKINIEIITKSNIISANSTYINFTYKSYMVYIIKLDDEWYLICYRSKYYKCDQLEGVIKCLQDI